MGELGGGASTTLFAGLRVALEQQRDLIGQRLAAVDQAEAAFARLGELFGMAPERPLEPREREQPPPGSIPPDATPPVLSAAEPPAAVCARVCSDCGAPVERKRRAGPAPKRCPGCNKAATRRRQVAWQKRRRHRRAAEVAVMLGAAADAEPIAEWERPFKVPIETKGSRETEDAALLRPPALPSEQAPELRTCGYCAEPFEPTTAEQRYCDKTCKAAASELKRTKRMGVEAIDQRFTEAVGSGRWA